MAAPAAAAAAAAAAPVAGAPAAPAPAPGEEAAVLETFGRLTVTRGDRTRTNVSSLRPFALLSKAIAALVQAIVADRLAHETDRSKDSDDIQTCARAVAALPMVRLDGELNQDWVIPIERTAFPVEGLEGQYAGGFEVIFPIWKGPCTFGSTGALAAAVGFTGRGRTTPINHALNPKHNQKEITTERAYTPPGGTDTFPAGTKVRVTQAVKKGPVQATFGTWSDPVRYPDSEAAYAALFGPGATAEQKNAFVLAANPANHVQTVALGVEVGAFPVGTRVRVSRTDTARPKDACVMAINLATRRVLLASYCHDKKRWRVAITREDAVSMDPAGFAATYGEVEVATMSAGTFLGRIGHDGSPFFVDAEQPEIDHINCDRKCDRMENLTKTDRKENNDNRDPPQAVRTPTVQQAIRDARTASVRLMDDLRRGRLVSNGPAGPSARRARIA